MDETHIVLVILAPPSKEAASAAGFCYIILAVSHEQCETDPVGMVMADGT